MKKTLLTAFIVILSTIAFSQTKTDTIVVTTTP